MADQEPKEIAPYQTIRRGDTWTSTSESVTFSDYSPRVMPVDGSESDESPKDSSAAESVKSSKARPTVRSVKSVPLPADKDSGQLKASE